MALKTIKVKIGLSAVAMSDRYIVTGAIDGAIFIFSIESSKFGHQVKLTKEFKYHKSYINSLYITQNMAVTGTRDGQVQIYDLENINSPTFFTAIEDREVSICSVNVNSLGDTIVAACDTGHIFTWNTETEERTLFFDYFNTSILCTQFSPQSPFLLASGDSQGCIRLHDLRTYPSLFQSINVASIKTNSASNGANIPTIIPGDISVRCLTYTQGGNCITWGSLNREEDNLVGFCDIRAKPTPMVNSFKTEAGCLSMVPSFSGKSVLVAHEDGFVNTVDYNYDELNITRSGRVSIFSELERAKEKPLIFSINSCPQNELIVTAGWAGKVKIWKGNHFDCA